MTCLSSFQYFSFELIFMFICCLFINVTLVCRVLDLKKIVSSPQKYAFGNLMIGRQDFAGTIRKPYSFENLLAGTGS